MDTPKYSLIIVIVIFILLFGLTIIKTKECFWETKSFSRDKVRI